MNDLISRQAVLDLLFNSYIKTELTSIGNASREYAELCVDELKELPSVTPAERATYRKKAKRWKKKYLALKTDIEKAKAEILKNYEKITGVYDENTPEDERPIQKIARNVARGECLEIINKHISGKEQNE